MSFVNELDDLCDFTKISQRWKQNKQEPNNKIASPAKTEANADCSSIASQKSNPWNKGTISSLTLRKFTSERQH